MPAKQKITPCLWFNGNAEEAMDFYMPIFEDSKILNTTNWGKEGEPRKARCSSPLSNLRARNILP